MHINLSTSNEFSMLQYSTVHTCHLPWITTPLDAEKWVISRCSPEILSMLLSSQQDGGPCVTAFYRYNSITMPIYTFIKGKCPLDSLLNPLRPSASPCAVGVRFNSLSTGYLSPITFIYFFHVNTTHLTYMAAVVKFSLRICVLCWKSWNPNIMRNHIIYDHQGHFT